MPKYNITEKRERSAVYRVLMSSEVKDDLQERINQKIIIEQKYKDKDYSAKQLADDLGTNVRYISAVCAERFHTNYCGLVNAQRVNEAMSMLVDPRYLKYRIEDILLDSIVRIILKAIQSWLSPKVHVEDHVKALENLLKCFF